MKRAFFIVGPESSGTRFIQRSFISAGCINKRDWMFNENDGKHNFNAGEDIVFHRSIPHQSIIPDLKALRLAMENSGFNVIPLLIVRDWHCTIMSQIRRGIVKDSDAAEKRIRKAITKVSTELPDFILITYETFCLSGFRDWLIMDQFGLGKPTESIYFQNLKYYGEDMKRKKMIEQFDFEVIKNTIDNVKNLPSYYNDNNPNKAKRCTGYLTKNEDAHFQFAINKFKVSKSVLIRYLILTFLEAIDQIAIFE